MSKATSYKVEVVAHGENAWVSNALRFASAKEAGEYGADLAWKWTGVKEWRVRPSTDPVNAVFSGSLQMTNPRPPAGWWDAMARRVRAQYPHRSAASHRKIIGGIWWGYPEETRERLVREYDQVRNPILETLGTAALTGAGLGTGFATASVVLKKILGVAQNPRLPKELGKHGRRRAIEEHYYQRHVATNPCTMAPIGAGEPAVSNPIINGLMISQANSKLGRLWNWSLTPGPLTGGGSCPGASEWCAKFCYASKGTSRMAFPQWTRNFRMAERSDFAQRMITAIHKLETVNVPHVMRVHVGGDFFSVKYVRDWQRIAASFPGWRFYAYTRCWRLQVPVAIRAEIAKLRMFPNFEIMASTDPTTGPGPASWREAGIDRMYRGNAVLCPALNDALQAKRKREGKKKFFCNNCLLCSRKGAKSVLLPVHSIGTRQAQEHKSMLAEAAKRWPA